MLIYRPNGRRRLGPLKRLLDEVETGLSRPNSCRMMMVMYSRILFHLSDKSQDKHIKRKVVFVMRTTLVCVTVNADLNTETEVSYASVIPTLHTQNTYMHKMHTFLHTYTYITCILKLHTYIYTSACT
jgi:hypothetical protein